MRCPAIAELPLPPTGKKGWPWTVETPQLSGPMPDGMPWPRISIVTPSYNQGEFIEETIRSILLQGYPDLEYIVMDGGSDDDSVAIIRKYERWVTYWESTPDKGQAHAINKGLTLATGVWFHNINSDDILYSGALYEVARVPDIFTAYAATVVNTDGRTEWTTPNRDLSARNFLLAKRPSSFSWHQPGVVFRTQLLRQVGEYHADYYLFDMLMTALYAERYPMFYYANQPLVRFRLHPASKTYAATPRESGFASEVRAELSWQLESSNLKKLARVEALRCEVERYLLNEDGLHYYKWRRFFAALLVTSKAPVLLFDRILLAALTGLLRARRSFVAGPGI